MRAYPLPGIPAFSIILFAGILSGNPCIAGTFDHDSAVLTSNKPPKEILIYIGFVGRKMIKLHHSTEFVVEVYRLPSAVVMQLNKLQFSPDCYDYKSLQKQQLLLSSLKDSCRVYGINNPVKYKYFYPQGLKKGMVIPGNEFSNWDFAEMIDIKRLVEIRPEKPDSAPAIIQSPVAEPDQQETKEPENKNPGGLIPEAGSMTTPYIVPGIRTYVFYPWDTDAKIDSDTPYNPSFDHFIDSLFLHLSDFSEYLGAQRIKLELYDQPLAATFYANVYIHYVDSIVNVLKHNPLIKPGDYENFILYTSEIVPKRFKYGANIRLWQGIRRDRLDCDNTAYLVYDIGKKLGFEISVVFVPGHALVVAGDYAYETTRRDYFPKEQLKDHYSIIYMISPDPKLIHAMLSILEIAIVLEEKNEHMKANDFKKILPRYFPGLKYPS